MTPQTPGKSCRQGMTLLELWHLFPDDATAEAWFVRCRWPQGMRCPHCQGDRTRASKHPTMPYRCRACYQFFSVKQGTVMQSAKIGYQKWAIALYRLTTGIKGVSSLTLHRDLGVTQKTAWHLAHRIRETWADWLQLQAGPVAVDETAVSGVRSRPSGPVQSAKKQIAMKTPPPAVPPAPAPLPTPAKPSALPPYRRSEPILATPEQVAQALLQTPPKTVGEWRYLQTAQDRSLES